MWYVSNSSLWKQKILNYINQDDRKTQHVVGGKHGKAITYFDNHHSMTRRLVIYLIAYRPTFPIPPPVDIALTTPLPNNHTHFLPNIILVTKVESREC